MKENFAFSFFNISFKRTHYIQLLFLQYHTVCRLEVDEPIKINNVFSFSFFKLIYCIVIDLQRRANVNTLKQINDVQWTKI